MITSVFLSDEAWKGLVRMAREANYIHPDSHLARGLGQFLKLLPAWSDSYMDTRPDYLKECDSIRAQQDPPLPPLWLDPDSSRAPRYLVLPTHSINSFKEIAEHFDIVNPRKARLSLRQSLMTRVSAVLEAIGLGYLTPTEIPLKAAFTRGVQRAKPVIDFDW